MIEIKKEKTFDLEERCFTFAQAVRKFIRLLPKDICTIEDGKQVVRSSGSVGANYIEANEALSKKDFLMRIKICRKEAKETHYWLRLLDTNSSLLQETKNDLTREAKELMMIMSAIMRKSQ